MNLYRFTDYREYIREWVLDAKSQGLKVSLGRICEAIQVQNTYMSRVLKKDADLNSDQAFLICQFFKFDKAETNYFNLLLEYSRSSMASRKKILFQEIIQIQEEYKNTKNHLQSKNVEHQFSEKFITYYLDPLTPIVHNFLTIVEYAKKPELIGPKLNIDAEKLKVIIERLKGLGIIEYNQKLKIFEVVQQHLHLPKDSVMHVAHQIFQRLQSLQKINATGESDKFFFNVVLSCDEATRKSIHEEFLKFIKVAEKLVQDSPAKDVYQLNFDLFRWS